MGVLTDYFTAPSDPAAAAALDGLLDLTPAAHEADREMHRHTPETASRPRLQIAANGTPVLFARGVDPVVMLGFLEAVLTGRTYERVRDDPRQGSLVAGGDGGTVLTVTDTLRDALAARDASALERDGYAWAAARRADGPHDVEDDEAAVRFAMVLSELATGAAARGEHLYCRVIGTERSRT
ncbi:hypothetical protein [Catenuloplanes japonicus]|uniref:hypothetical protein n=1 Tax=Catenuloplanes japonicus TaxID=33876 RepID=UPI000525D0F2|nr:hypothetical protein [Catenuloplanes japonicus]